MVAPSQPPMNVLSHEKPTVYVNVCPGALVATAVEVGETFSVCRLMSVGNASAVGTGLDGATTIVPTASAVIVATLTNRRNGSRAW